MLLAAFAPDAHSGDFYMPGEGSAHPPWAQNGKQSQNSAPEAAIFWPFSGHFLAIFYPSRPILGTFDPGSSRV
jgi:hypothetical protein